MKKFFILPTIAFSLFSQAQFGLHIKGPENFATDDAFLYTLSGSKDILVSKISAKGGSWDYKVAKPYTGMMKLYFPKHNSSVNFISENKDIDISFESSKNKISYVDYKDEANKLMNERQDFIQKKEQILPALYQLQEYYRPGTEFGTAVARETARLSSPVPAVDGERHPFIKYYSDNYSKYLQSTAAQKALTKSEVVGFLSNTGFLLESSGLLRPMLINYVNNFGKDADGKGIDDLLNAVNVETPRGQVILAELIDIFDAYDLTTLKDKYLALASGLKCSINDQLASTIKNNKNVELGAKLPDYTFGNPINTSAKSIYGVKSDRKIIFFWSSTCSHCEAEIPVLLKNYGQLKEKGVEIVGLSFDSNADEYLAKAKSLPWINDSELRGWYASYAETYNIHATPTYFVVDSGNKIIAKPDHVQDILEFFKLK